MTLCECEWLDYILDTCLSLFWNINLTSYSLGLESWLCCHSCTFFKRHLEWLIHHYCHCCCHVHSCYSIEENFIHFLECDCQSSIDGTSYHPLMRLLLNAYLCIIYQPILVFFYRHLNSKCLLTSLLLYLVSVACRVRWTSCATYQHWWWHAETLLITRF